MSSTLSDSLRSEPADGAVLPVVGACVSIPVWKRYCWPLLEASLLAWTIHATDSGCSLCWMGRSRAGPAGDALHACQRERFRSLSVEAGARVELQLRRRDGLAAFDPPACRGIVHLTRLRQRMLEYFLYE